MLPETIKNSSENMRNMGEYLCLKLVIGSIFVNVSISCYVSRNQIADFVRNFKGHLKLWFCKI